MPRTDIIPRVTDKNRWIYANAARAQMGLAFSEKFILPETGLEYAEEQALYGALLIHLSKQQNTYSDNVIDMQALGAFSEGAQEAAKYLLEQAAEYELTAGEFAVFIGERVTASSSCLVRAERELQDG